MDLAEYCLKVKVDNSLEQFLVKPYHFKVIYFKDKTHEQSKFRPWVIFRINDKELCCVIIECTTSPKKMLVYKFDDIAGSCVVQVPKKVFPIAFPADLTYIDCNLNVECRKNIDELKNIIDWDKGIKVIKEELPQNLLEKIVKSIVKSPFTSDDIRVALKEEYLYLFDN